MLDHLLIALGVLTLIFSALAVFPGLREQISAEFSEWNKNKAIVAVIALGGGIQLLSSSSIAAEGTTSAAVIGVLALGYTLLVAGTAMGLTMLYWHYKASDRSHNQR